VTVWTKWAAMGKWLIAAMLCSSAVAHAQDPAVGDSVYHSDCTSCHNNNPNLIGGGGGPAVAGASDSLIQTRINAGMGAPNTTPYVTGNNATIHATVRDIGAYLRNLNYPVLQLGGNTSFNFGSILTTQTATTTFTIRNNKAGSDNLVITSITPSAGAIRASQNCVGGIAASTTCIVTVTFDPPSAGFFSTTFTISNSNAFPASNVTGTFSGTATVPTPGFSRSPPSLTLVGRVSPLQTDGGVVTISNPGSATANLILSALNFSRPEFTRTGGTCVIGGAGMAPGALGCTVNVTYTPSATGPQNGSLTILHNAPSSPDFVTLNATGTQSLINPTVASVPFGNVQQGNNALLTQGVGNTGTATLNFTAPLPNSPAALTGSGAGDYTVTGCAAPVGAGLNCTLNITFTPSVVGARPATLTINSDATNGPLVISLTGEGVILPEPVVTGPSSDFPDTVINQVSAQTRTITIDNPRTNPIVYSVAAITDFSIDAESCATRNVPGGGSCTLTITFRPLLGAGETRRTGSYAFTFTGTLGNVDPSPVNVSVAGNALLPLAQSTSTINAAAVVGSPTTASMLLTNRSSSPITLSTLLFSGAAAADYSLAAGNACTPGLVMVPSSNCTLVVRFDPPTAGARNATLTITHSAAGSPQTVALLGAATPAPQGRIELSESNLAFADTQLASTSARTVTVHNGGDLALNFSAFTFGGTHPGDFSRSGTCAVGVALPINADCTVIVTFAPTVLGLRTATLSIASDASNGTAVIAVSGTGVPIPVPQVSLTPPTLDFGTQTIGGLYPARRIRLANSGTADLNVASVTASGTGFAIAASTCPSTLAPAAGCDIDIAFAPAAAQAYTGALTVVSNAAGSPHATVLRGTGSATALPVLVFSPAVTTLDFGSVSAGTVSAPQTVTVLNQGPGGATLTLLNAIGGDAASFSVVGGTCAIGTVLFEAATCTISVQFAPGSSGTKTAQVQIASTGSFPPVLTLTGVGLAGPNPSLELSTAALAFDDTKVGSQSLPSTVRLSSSGSGVVTVSAIAVTGTYGIDSTTCPPVPFTLPAGTDCTVSVSFRPTDDGAAAGTLSITSDTAPALREVVLSGSGEDKADTSSGGCTIGDGRSPADPLLWTMVLAAAAWLVSRRVQRSRARRATTTTRREPLN
jgi:hypothetical protein